MEVMRCLFEELIGFVSVAEATQASLVDEIMKLRQIEGGQREVNKTFFHSRKL